MIYVNWKYQGAIETVDEFETLTEARDMVTEYRLAFSDGFVYLSRRSTKDWRERGAA